MFQKIVLAVDGSDRDERAVRAAVALAEKGAHVTVVHVSERAADGASGLSSSSCRSFRASLACLSAPLLPSVASLNDFTFSRSVV